MLRHLGLLASPAVSRIPRMNATGASRLKLILIAVSCANMAARKDNRDERSQDRDRG